VTDIELTPESVCAIGLLLLSERREQLSPYGRVSYVGETPELEAERVDVPSREVLE
jgi:hypothetical protein